MMMVVPVRKGNISVAGIPMVFRMPTVTTPAPISVRGPRFMPKGARTASAMAITRVFSGTTGARRTLKYGAHREAALQNMGTVRKNPMIAAESTTPSAKALLMLRDSSPPDLPLPHSSSARTEVTIMARITFTLKAMTRRIGIIGQSSAIPGTRPLSGTLLGAAHAETVFVPRMVSTLEQTRITAIIMPQVTAAQGRLSW